MKRDNIEDLLTTIFASVARSNLLNTTIQYLVTDQRFESTVVELLQGVFENIGSTLTGILDTDWSALQPLVSSLLNSGLLTDFISRAFNDDELKAVLWNDITLILKETWPSEMKLSNVLTVPLHPCQFQILLLVLQLKLRL